MRISDWSSDVCSSDLTPAPPRSPRWHRASFPAPVGAPLERGGAAAVALVDAAFDVIDEAARAFVAGLQREGVVQAAGRGARLVAPEIGRAAAGNRVTNAQLVCPLLTKERNTDSNIQ